MRKRIMIVILILFYSVIGCSDIKQDKDEKFEEKYVVITKSFKKEKIDVKYPQIRGLKNKEKEREINGLIKSQLFDNYIDGNVKTAKEFTVRNGIDDEFILSMDFRVTMKTNEILSILYTSRGSFKTSMHPDSAACGITINLQRVEVLSLSDFIDVDESLIKKMKSSEKMTNSRVKESDKFMTNSGTEESLKTMTKQELINVTRLSIENVEDDIVPSEYITTYAVTSKSLLIIFPISHAAGDYVIIEVPYDHK